MTGDRREVRERSSLDFRCWIHFIFHTVVTRYSRTVFGSRVCPSIDRSDPCSQLRERERELSISQATGHRRGAQALKKYSCEAKLEELPPTVAYVHPSSRLNLFAIMRCNLIRLRILPDISCVFRHQAVG